MGLKNVFKKAATSAVTAFGDIPEAATLFKATSDQPVYDPSAVSVATSGNSFTISKAVFSAYQERDIDNEKILPTDEIAYIPSLFCSATPETDDIITKSDSSEWVVINVATDAAGALHTCQIRPK